MQKYLSVNQRPHESQEELENITPHSLTHTHTPHTYILTTPALFLQNKMRGQGLTHKHLLQVKLPLSNFVCVVQRETPWVFFYFNLTNLKTTKKKKYLKFQLF